MSSPAICWARRSRECAATVSTDGAAGWGSARMEDSGVVHSIARISPKVRLGPAGIRVFDRKTGTNALLDEVPVPPASWSITPRHVGIALTNACDLSCPYCFAPKKPAALDFDQVVGWLEELDSGGSLSVGFGGGEPTLYRRLGELCHYAASRTQLAVTLTTHGHHLTPNLIGALTGAVHFVRVSVDGVGLTYEALRGRSFSALRKRLEAVRSLAPLGITLSSTASRSPISMPQSSLPQMQASTVPFAPEQPVRGRGGIDEKTREALQRWVRYYHGSVPLAVSESGAVGLPSCNPLDGESGLRAYHTSTRRAS